MSFRGAAIRRVDMPQLGLLCIELRHPEPKYLLLSAGIGAVGAAATSERIKGLRASPFVTQLRQHLVGARVSSIRTVSGAVELAATRHDDTLRLIGHAKKQGSAWWLLDASGKTIVQSGDSGAPIAPTRWNEAEWESLIGADGALLEARVASSRKQLTRELDKAYARLERKRDAISNDLKKASEGETIRHKAELLLANLHEVADGAPEVVLTDWVTQAPITVELEKGESATDAANRLFRRAKKLDRSVPIASARLAEASSLLRDVEQLLQRVASAADHRELQPLWMRAADLELLSQGALQSAKRRKTRRAMPYRHFVGHRGADIFVGRGPAQNDALTLRVAAPHDLWLHARGTGGAHVVVRLQRGAACPSELLVDAATLAAHFSSLKGESIIDVLYTPRRYVRKRRGAPPGTVILDREKVIAVRMQSERLKKLLASERR